MAKIEVAEAERLSRLLVKLRIITLMPRFPLMQPIAYILLDPPFLVNTCLSNFMSPIYKAGFQENNPRYYSNFLDCLYSLESQKTFYNCDHRFSSIHMTSKLTFT